MKKLNILSAVLLMGSMAFAAPQPKSARKVEKEHKRALARVQNKDHRDHEKEVAVKSAKDARKIAKQNNSRYRHEARDRRDFNNM